MCLLCSTDLTENFISDAGFSIAWSQRIRMPRKKGAPPQTSSSCSPREANPTRIRREYPLAWHASWQAAVAAPCDKASTYHLRGHLTPVCLAQEKRLQGCFDSPLLRLVYIYYYRKMLLIWAVAYSIKGKWGKEAGWPKKQPSSSQHHCKALHDWLWVFRIPAALIDRKFT